MTAIFILRGFSSSDKGSKKYRSVCPPIADRPSRHTPSPPRTVGQTRTGQNTDRRAERQAALRRMPDRPAKHSRRSKRKRGAPAKGSTPHLTLHMIVRQRSRDITGRPFFKIIRGAIVSVAFNRSEIRLVTRNRTGFGFPGRSDPVSSGRNFYVALTRTGFGRIKEHGEILIPCIDKAPCIVPYCRHSDTIAVFISLAEFPGIIFAFCRIGHIADFRTRTRLLIAFFLATRCRHGKAQNRQNAEFSHKISN